MNTSNRSIETQINLKEVIWDLLVQWKAVLIAALIAALLVSGAKFAKDSRDFNVSNEAQKESEAQMTMSAEERIAQILDSLDADEQKTVRYILSEQEWIDRQREYLSDSILMNMDPTNQRRLSIVYDIDAENVEDLSVLLNIYSNLNQDENLVKKVGTAIASDSDVRYVYELISVQSSSVQSSSVQSSSVQSSSVQSSSIAFAINVILPEDADAKAVEVALTDAATEYANDIKRDYPHDITLVRTRETRFYNADAAANNRDYFNNVNALETNIKNAQSSLSDLQKSAIEQIETIKVKNRLTETPDADLNENEVQTSAPTWSKKYALLGFVLGVILYAFIYLMQLIMKGRLNYATDASYYTGTRLLGERYKEIKYTGFGALTHSRFIDKLRYRDRLDVDKQLKEASEAIEAACEHINVRDICILNLSENAAELSKAIDKQGIKTSIIEISAELHEKELLSVKNAIIVIDNSTKVSALLDLMERCCDYDINLLGTFFEGVLSI